jgi:hypothetical protein
MTGQPLIESDRCCLAQLTKGEHWVRLKMALTEEFTGGELVRFAEHAQYSVEGADDLSATYNRVNWTSGVASGVLYAFRTLKIPRRHILLREFAGRLRASDMEAVVRCAAIGVAKLANRDLPLPGADGWEVQLQLLAPAPANGPQQRLGDAVLPAPEKESS